MINFGIDLGTTNSAIAKFDKGDATIFKNPVGHKETLPSVVAFRKSRIVVGEKAREYLLRDPQNVVGSFKRKMGTSEVFRIASLGEDKSPMELSALVLKELKNFIHTGEVPQAAVITIPASFDTVQSNATQKAGTLAGFEQVVLLQEPIAASLAYANKDEADKFEEGRWLVYDLGGGTFDVALVQIQDGEMKVVDHEGDNFLGGTDFDKEIVEKLIIPYLEQEGRFENLEREMKSASGKYNKLYYTLLHKAEEAKVVLSAHEETEIEFEIEDDDGEWIDGYMTIHRSDFEALIEPYIMQSCEMTKEIVKRNQLKASDLKFVLMVGGSTYIPYVREQVHKLLEVSVNCNIDPTTAVAMGAAFYAGTKNIRIQQPKKEAKAGQLMLDVKTAYQKASQDESEYFTAKIDGDITGLSYRVIRQDGGFDSGLRPLEHRISLDLPLLADSYNYFDFKIYDAKGNELEHAADTIGIAHGRYSVVGQPLPNDISIEVDDLENQTTVLETIFEKNAILPLRRTFVKEITQTIRKGSSKRLTINVVEGPSFALPSANQTIGFISISGEDLTRDLVKGSDIEITLEISESRELTINAYLMLTDQEYEDVFMPSERQVNVYRLKEDFEKIRQKLKTELKEAEEMENYEVAGKLQALQTNLTDAIKKVNRLSEDDVTDEKFQLEDKKRKIAQAIDALTRDKHIIKIKMAYFDTKHEVESIMENYGASVEEKKTYDELIQREKSVLMSNSTLKIKELTDKMWKLSMKIRWRDPNYIKFLFYHFSSFADVFVDREKGAKFIEQGKDAIEKEEWDRLRNIVNQLAALMPASAPKPPKSFGGTGIG